MIPKLKDNRLISGFRFEPGTTSSQPCSAPRASPYATKRVVLSSPSQPYLVAAAKTTFDETAKEK